jgi:hypothetical protein
MFKKCIIVVAVALAAAWLTSEEQAAYATGIAGVEDLRWGITRQEVETLHPNFENWEEQEYNPFNGNSSLPKIMGCDLSSPFVRLSSFCLLSKTD